MIPVYYIFNCLFSVLLVLHIIWFYYIVKIAYTVRTISQHLSIVLYTSQTVCRTTYRVIQ